MSKIVDSNGYWLIRNNPITKPGVYKYLGRQISPELEPMSVYGVYRPLSEISSPATLESFDGVPLIDEHEMLGEGFTDYDKRPASGVLMHPHEVNGVVCGDIRIFSEDLQRKIMSGKKELSLGYRCDYDRESGEYQGEHFDFIQRNLRGNHIALVSRGRMGSDVRVYDGFATDSIDVVGSEIEKGEDNMEEEKKESPEVNTEDSVVEPEKKDVPEQTEEVPPIAKEEKKEDCSCKDEDKSSQDEGEEKGQDECAEKTEDESDGEEKKTEDECGEEKKDESPAMDEAVLKAAIGVIERRNALANSLATHVGDFATDGMTEEEVALYGAKKLGLDAANGHDAIVACKAFLVGAKSAKSVKPSMDSAPEIHENPTDAFIKKYLGRN